MGEVRVGGTAATTLSIYGHIHPHSENFPHALIHAPSSNCATSAISPLGLKLSFSGRVNPPPHHSPNNGNIYPHILSLSLYFSLSFYSNSCTTSPLSLLVVYHYFFSILHSVQSLSPRSSLSFLTRVYCRK